MLNMLLFIPSGGEILLIFLVVLILFGADKIPDLARMFGKGLREFRRATDDIKREFDSTTHEITDDFDTEKDSIKTEIDELKTSMDTSLSEEDPYADNNDEPEKPNRTFIDEDQNDDTISENSGADKNGEVKTS